MGKVRTIIDSRGVVQIAASATEAASLRADVGNNVSGLPVGGQISTTLSGGTGGTLGTNITASLPGMYALHSECTCSIPAASAYPGAEYIFSVITGSVTSRPFLTGACSTTDLEPRVFWVSGSNMMEPTGLEFCSRLYLQNRGSVILKSNGLVWLPVACSGTLSGSVYSLAAI